MFLGQEIPNCKIMPDLDSVPPTKKEFKSRKCCENVRVVGIIKIPEGHEYYWKCTACDRSGRAEDISLFENLSFIENLSLYS